MNTQANILTFLALAAFCVPADAGGGPARSVADMRADPSIPVFGSPFFTHPDFANPPATANLLPAGDLAATKKIGAPTAPPPPTSIEEIPALTASMLPVAREHFAPGLAAIHGREPMSEPQRAAVAAVAKSAFELNDIDTLAQLALLMGGRDERALQAALSQALTILKYRPFFIKAPEAAKVLRMIDRRAALPDDVRAWMAEQVGARVAKTYLGVPVP